ncbi:MAG: glycosyltransferase family 39 protein [Planctomycetales bacterium]
MQGHCSPIQRHVSDSLGRRSALAILAIAFVYCLALAPLAVTYLAYHPDERHYTDGAILMVHSGDYLTPRDPDGTPRFLKPAICYWIIAASYQLFGISSFSSRLPFLLLGGGVIVLSALIAFRATRHRSVAHLTALIMATNPLLVLASIYSLTDVVQIFCLLLSLLGWILLLRDPDSRSAPWWICIGTSLAIATKGVPGVLLATYAILFLRYNPWRRISLRRSAWIAPCLVGTIIASDWYLAMFLQHGTDAWACFFEDQVNSRIPLKWWHPLRQIPLAPLLYLALLFPWSLPVLRSFRSNIRPQLPQLPPDQKLILAFLAGWPLLLLAPLSVISPFTVRYFLLATPMLAILCAWFWNQLPEWEYLPRVRTWRTRILSGVSVAIGAAALFLMLNRAHWTWPLYAATLILFGVGAVALRRVRNPRTRRCAGLAGGFLIFFPLLFTIAAPLGLPDQAEAIAARLENAIPADQQPEIWFVGKPAMAAKMRVYLHDSHPFHSAEALTLEHLPTGPQTWVICRQEDAEQGLDPRLYQWETASHGYKDLKPGEMFLALWHGTLDRYLATRQQAFVIARPKPAEQCVSAAE